MKRPLLDCAVAILFFAVVIAMGVSFQDFERKENLRMGFTKDEKKILESIPSTEPADFGEFCQGLEDLRPEKGDSASWSIVFQFLDRAEREGLIEQEKVGGRMEGVILTDEGKDLVRSFR